MERLDGLSDRPHVIVVDDDDGFRNALMLMLRRLGCSVDGYAGIDRFRAAVDPHEAAVVFLDVRLGTVDGVEEMQSLRVAYDNLLFIMMTGFGSFPSAVRAIKQGALDYIEKPITFESLRTVLQLAVTELRQRVRRTRAANAAVTRWLELTARERQIAAFVALGHTSGEIGGMLGISERTVQVHRLNILRKLHLNGSIELVGLIEAVKAHQPALVPSSVMMNGVVAAARATV